MLQQLNEADAEREREKRSKTLAFQGKYAIVDRLLSKTKIQQAGSEEEAVVESWAA